MFVVMGTGNMEACGVFFVCGSGAQVAMERRGGVGFRQYVVGLCGSGARRTDGTLGWGDAPAA